MLTQKELKELLNYDPKTGLFTWLVPRPNCVNIGDVAGCIGRQGYINIKIKGVQQKAHRLAWLYVHGRFPPNDIDHKNLIKSDNIWRNLREATNSQNHMNTTLQSNNRSGYKGVGWHKQTGKWRARCAAGGKSHYLGLFSIAEEASAVREAFAKERHGEFFHE